MLAAMGQWGEVASSSGQFGHLQHPLHHGERLGIQERTPLGILQQLDQLFFVLRFAAEGPQYLLEPGSGDRTVARVVVTHDVLSV